MLLILCNSFGNIFCWAWLEKYVWVFAEPHLHHQAPQGSHLSPPISTFLHSLLSQLTLAEHHVLLAWILNAKLWKEGNQLHVLCTKHQYTEFKIYLVIKLKLLNFYHPMFCFVVAVGFFVCLFCCWHSIL